jgi:hypothetical protein
VASIKDRVSEIADDLSVQRSDLADLANDMRAMQTESEGLSGLRAELTDLRIELTQAKDAFTESGVVPGETVSERPPGETSQTRRLLLENQERLDALSAAIIGLTEEARETRIVVEDMRKNFATMAAAFLSQLRLASQKLPEDPSPPATDREEKQPSLAPLPSGYPYPPCPVCRGMSRPFPGGLSRHACNQCGNTF